MQKKSIAMMLIVFLCGATLAFAADQDRDRTRDRKKDGSCNLIQKAADHLQAADRTRARSRQPKRVKQSTGSNLVHAAAAGLLVADRDRTRTKDKKRDGSCDLTV